MMNRHTTRILAVGFLAILVCLAATTTKVDYPTQIKNKPLYYSSEYIFTSFPGGSIAAGAIVKTFTPCPVGLNGNDVGHYVSLSGGSGTEEIVLITGGTCLSGAATGTLNFTAANSHSGTWKIQSVTDGIREAEAARGVGVVTVGPGVHLISAPIYIHSGITLHCEVGSVIRMAPGTLENFYTDNGMLFNNDAYFTDIAIDGCEVDGDAVEQPDPLNSCGNFCGALLHFGPGTVTADCHRISIRNNYWHGYAGVPGNLGGAIGLLCATGTALEFSHNQISAADGHGGGFLSTAPGTLIAYNTLLGTGWGDCGLTLNNTTSDGGIVSSNVLNGNPICIEGSSNFLVTDNIISNITANYAINIGNLAGEHGIVARNIITNNPASTNCIGVTVSGIQTLDILDNVCTLVSGGFANPGGMPNVTSADWNVRAKGVKTGTFSVFMGCSGAVAAGATVWLGMSTASPCSTVAFSGATQMPSTPYAYTYMRHLRVEIGAAAVHDIVATLYVNGGPNPLTCTILTGQLNCADLVNLAPVPALGGRLAIGVATQAGETATDVFASWEM